MREQLIQYVNLLFAGAPDSEDIRLEILQNTLDRYDDLVSQGKSPEAAYRLAISGIGDINEILGETQPAPVWHTAPSTPETEQDTPLKKVLRACAVGLYILCPVPLFVLTELGMDTLGLCGTLTLVAVATALIMLGAKKDKEESKHEARADSPRQELNKSIATLIRTLSLVIFLVVSFLTGAWFSTWLIFPIAACVRGLINAIIDLKEVTDHEA